MPVLRINDILDVGKRYNFGCLHTAGKVNEIMLENAKHLDEEIKDFMEFGDYGKMTKEEAVAYIRETILGDYIEMLEKGAKPSLEVE